MNNTIFNAEQALYLYLIQLSKYHPRADQWLASLPSWLSAIKDKRRYAHAPSYAATIDRLPDVTAMQIELRDKVEAMLDWELADFKKTHNLLANLKPWRKGPFYLSSGSTDRSIHIDTEWRSDFKWERVRKHLDLYKKRILDVGGGSGYHGFRMLGDGAKSVIVIDPSCLFYHQFMAIKHFMGVSLPIHYIPVALEELPRDAELFDVVFSMGVLYHRTSPFEHLDQLKGQLNQGGTLVLETLIVDGDEQTVLVPESRYAQMNNVYFLPSIAALTKWLVKVGFKDVRCVDVDVTSTDEQRATAWMDYHSLVDFLDPNDDNKTLEGYPRPKRAVMLATK
ncbi:tRNA 5-methoxyuridine(34)/uridine 5-oxyacetic acid(34) synthase CmoB [Moraxella sp. Tifton1]|uniref:tRNA 5-methoxyuridine(34)/uridine 5-oxyacetic acid(34) synthase CmoB n=1 Tax=Moraxella oculi TaxID=2940516 RepID=UPI0020112139|nr:tRNA 5-methoxyuridine(34)/uridine 5-oxyacetic acid(34) synthase CmoB [Moraxella sp. Tifton1]MCL1623048.1 tRNA 5-methoxyuridine(34)/uridine 5-oxyacetic acid(34) synthase CmoB [Moraxella sp. Tifton1]